MGKIEISNEKWNSMKRFASWSIAQTLPNELEIENTHIPPEPETEAEPSPDKPQPMGWSPHAGQEEMEEEDKKTPEELWQDVEVSFVVKNTKMGPLSIVVLNNTSQKIANDLKNMKYKAFKNNITGEWTWSKIVNKYKSTEIDQQKLGRIKDELQGKGVDVAPLNTSPVESNTSSPKATSQDPSEETLVDIPEEFIKWHNEMEAARKLSPKERKNKYSDIIENVLEEVGQKVESDATSQESQKIVKSLLDSMENFHNYSFWNSMMIAFTKPGAQYVASRKSWKLMGRIPKSDAVSIPIMYPYKKTMATEDETREMTDEEVAKKVRTFFGLGSAIAYEDTEPISPEWTSKRGRWKGKSPFEPPEWQINTNQATEWLNQLYASTYKWATEKKKFQITSESMELSGGYATLNGKIAINDKSEGMRKLTTLFHEIAHQLIHFDPNFNRKEATKQERETDAEATAYVVCKHYHIENKDTPIYLAGFQADKNSILGRFKYIQKAAIEMFENIDEEMMRLNIEQGDIETSQEQGMIQANNSLPIFLNNYIGNLSF